VSDVAVFEEYPSQALAFLRRMHRWVRGDWQILPWLFRHVPGADGKKLRNSLDGVYCRLRSLRSCFSAGPCCPVPHGCGERWPLAFWWYPSYSARRRRQRALQAASCAGRRSEGLADLRKSRSTACCLQLPSYLTRPLLSWMR
jgi:hypothetical protein